GGAQRELRVCERAALLLFGLLETPSPATMASPSPIPGRVRTLFIFHIRPKVSARYFAIRAERPESPPQMGRAQAMRHRMFLSLHPINPLARISWASPPALRSSLPAPHVPLPR